MTRNGSRRSAAPAELADIYTCRQGEPLGLGHAVCYAESHVGGEPFAVLLGDEFVDEDEPLLPAMLDLQARTGGIVLALHRGRPGDEVEPVRHRLGRPASRAGRHGRRRRGHRPGGEAGAGQGTEQPRGASAATSCPSAIFDAIRRTKPGSGGEIQLTDAMALLLAEGTPVHGIVYRGTRYDTGMPLGYLQAVVQLACQRDDLARSSGSGWPNS